MPRGQNPGFKENILTTDREYPLLKTVSIRLSEPMNDAVRSKGAAWADWMREAIQEKLDKESGST